MQITTKLNHRTLFYKLQILKNRKITNKRDFAKKKNFLNKDKNPRLNSSFDESTND